MHPWPASNEYGKLAKKCFRLAREAKTETDRLACLDLGQKWLEARSRQEEMTPEQIAESEPKPETPRPQSSLGWRQRLLGLTSLGSTSRVFGARAGVRYAANTIEEMQKLLCGYRDNMRVEIEAGIAVAASTVAELRALPTWPNGLVLNIHIDLDPRFSVVRVERAS